MIDVSLLRVMRHRNDYYRLRDIIPRASLGAETVSLINDFGRYFEKHPNHKEVDLTTFLPRFKAWYPKMKQERLNQFINVLRNAAKPVDDDTRTNIMGELAEIELMTALANLANQHEDGELPDAFQAVSSALEGYRSRLGLKSIVYIDTPIGELLQDEFDDSGLSWRLTCMNESMRGLRPGDFGIVAGRPDKGKTTFMTCEVTNFAAQLPPDRNVIWLNNEGPGKRIIPRLYQSALNVSMSELKELHAAGKAEGMYREAIGGRLDKIRIIDIHGCNTGHVETILDENNPGVIVYDMIDNIRGFGHEARTDLQLEEMYKWARERSVKYDCIGLATSQISNDGDGLQFPTLGMLKDSKTGKQGACDFQLMLGASNDPGLATSRFVGLPKNKLRRPDGPADPRAEVIFDGIRARYKDVPIGT
ncbi:AAA family ATPase [Kaustia mangrovi]|uniref:AAA family ATPase n=1 Tax=Kaustia mangrovi TaxID=2593653 RepID=A0A7S8C7Q5_9HYPH|nr:AAA family ATPase [Kaustia mangrovi]QPC44950.1 AAA family ATPase [Kaustia mangrovi]